MIRLRIDKVCQPGLEYKHDMRISAWRDTMKTALAVIRTRCNYSQTTLASVLGLSRQVVSAWENGNKKIPEGRLAPPKQPERFVQVVCSILMFHADLP